MIQHASASASDSLLPADSLVLVTGAGGFVGGHVARTLASSGYRVRGLCRRLPKQEPGDPPIDWLVGDIRDPETRRRAVEGAKGVIHTAGWVSLGPDPRNESRSINVEATRDLLDNAERSGVERFVHTSTLWTVASGTTATPADEASAWNLDLLRSPYCDSKREAETIVLERARPGFGTMVINPGLVIGIRDVRPTSTRVMLEMSKVPVAFLPNGGIPFVDARVLARAHIRAMEMAEPGQRYIVLGRYLSYLEMASIVSRIAGWPRKVVRIPDGFQSPLRWSADLISRLRLRRTGEISAAAVSGGFVQLHVSGARADAIFGLTHPSPAASIFEALDDSRRAGRAPWLKSLRPIQE